MAEVGSATKLCVCVCEMTRVGKEWGLTIERNCPGYFGFRRFLVNDAADVNVFYKSYKNLKVEKQPWENPYLTVKPGLD